MLVGAQAHVSLCWLRMVRKQAMYVSYAVQICYKQFPLIAL